MTTTISIIVLSQFALMVFPLEMQLRDNCVHVYLSLFLGCVEVVCVCDMNYKIEINHHSFLSSQSQWSYLSCQPHSQAPPKLFSHIICLIFHTLCDWKAEEELRSTFLVEGGLGARWAETNALHGTLLLCPPMCAVCNQESIMSQLGQPLSHLGNQLNVLTHVHQALKRKVIRMEVEGQEANVGLQLYGCLFISGQLLLYLQNKNAHSAAICLWEHSIQHTQSCHSIGF